jgi:hypothetical protein
MTPASLFGGALTQEQRDHAHRRFLRDAEKLVTNRALLADLIRERQRGEQLTIGAALRERPEEDIGNGKQGNRED